MLVRSSPLDPNTCWAAQEQAHFGSFTTLQYRCPGCAEILRRGCQPHDHRRGVELLVQFSRALGHHTEDILRLYPWQSADSPAIQRGCLGRGQFGVCLPNAGLVASQLKHGDTKTDPLRAERVCGKENESGTNSGQPVDSGVQRSLSSRGPAPCRSHQPRRSEHEPVPVVSSWQ